MFHLRRVDFHQYVRKVGNGTGGAVPDAAATPAATAITGEEHREIADGPGPVKGKSAKVRATMILLDHNTKIGRNPELVDVVLHSVHYSNMISRDHSEIIGEVDKNGQFVQYHIRDNSLNGTYVNEIRVDGKQLLKEGDLIKFGHANGAAIKPGQFAPQVQSEFVFKFERALADYHYCGFTEQRARLYPGLKRAYLQVYSDRAEPELIPFEKGSVTLCGSAQPSTTVVPPASAVHPLPATTSRRPKTLTKHAALTTIDTTSPAAQAAPSTSAAQGVTANASSVTTSRPVVTNTATTATVNPYAVVASNLQPANPPALPQLSAGMPGHTIVDDVAAAAWMQQQQQQLQRYGGGFALNALAAAASSYLSQNPASYAAALWPWAGPSRLQPNLATDWNQLRQHAAAAAYPGGAPAVAALHQHLQQVPQFASPYSLTASNAPSFISTSITGASSHGFALPAAVASIASAFSSLASTCYGGSVASTPASSGSDSTTSYSNIAASRCAAVYSNSTTPASAAKLPNYLGAPGTASSPVGSLPAGLAAVLPALAGRPNALAQWTTPTASAFSVPPAGTPSSACPVASLAPSENASDASLALSGSASQVPQDPHPNQPLKSASGGIRLIASSASSTSSLSSATPDKPLSALSETSLSTITSDAKETPPKSHGKSEIASPVPRRFQVGDVKAEDNLSNCRVEAKPQATFAPHEVRSVCDAEPSTSTASDAKDSLMRISGVVDCRPSPSVFVRNSDGGAVPKNEEDAPVPSTPEPAKRHERAPSLAESLPSRPGSLPSLLHSPPRAPRPVTVESRSPTASRSPAPIDGEESKKRDDDTDAAPEKCKSDRAKPIKHARKSNEVVRLLNDLTAGNCSWMHQATRSLRRQDESAKKKAPRLSVDEHKLKGIQKRKAHKMMRQISDESSDDSTRAEREPIERQKKKEFRKAGKKTPERKCRNPTPPNTTAKRRGSDGVFAAPLPKRTSTAGAVAKTSTAAVMQRRSKFKRAKSTSGSDSDEKTAPKKAATKAEAATTSSDDDEEDEADSDTYDKCAHTNCRRPRYDNVNWVQCDVCDEWYHNLCILGAEKAVVEDEFHCGCAKNSRRKPAHAQRPKKRQAV